jgi:hypothetical protein
LLHGGRKSASDSLCRNDIATKSLGKSFFGHRTIGDTKDDDEEIDAIGANVMP